MDAVYTPTLDAYLSSLAPGVKTVDKDFARAARFFFFLQLYEHDVKFPFARLFGGRKNRDKFNFFSESELGCSHQDYVGKFTYICHFKRVEIKAQK